MAYKLVTKFLFCFIFLVASLASSAQYSSETEEAITAAMGAMDAFMLAFNARDPHGWAASLNYCLLYTSPSPRDLSTSRMPSSA